MQSGVITEDNYSQALRPISKRRQSGVFEITWGAEVFKIFFHQGKVIDVRLKEESNMQLLFDRFARGGVLKPLEEVTVENYDEGLELFCQETSLAKENAKDIYTFAVQELHYQNLLLFTPQKSGAIFEFRMEGVDFNPDYHISLSVGQYLISLSEYSAIQSKIVAFEEDDSLFITLISDYTGEDIHSLAIVDLFKESNVQLFDDLRLRSLLSDYHFGQAFFSLLEDQILEASTDSSLDEQGEDVLGFLAEALNLGNDNIESKVFEENKSESKNELPEEESATIPPLAPLSSEETVEKTSLNKKLLRSKFIPSFIVFLLWIGFLLSVLVYWRDVLLFLGRA